jgi:hypothetical protein
MRAREKYGRARMLDRYANKDKRAPNFAHIWHLPNCQQWIRIHRCVVLRGRHTMRAAWSENGRRGLRYGGVSTEFRQVSSSENEDNG